MLTFKSDEWFSVKGNSLLKDTEQYLEIFLIFTTLGMGLLLASSRQRSWILLSILQWTTNSYSIENVKLEKTLNSRFQRAN